MRRPIRQLTALAVSLSCGIAAASCDSMSTLGGSGILYGGPPGNTGPGGGSDSGGGGGDAGGGGDSGGGGDDGGGSDGGAQSDAPMLPSCAFTAGKEQDFCTCLGNWNCGGTTATDMNGTNQTVYCGKCANTEYCVPDPLASGAVGKCGGMNPLAYDYQKQKIDILVAMGENDSINVLSTYATATNLNDGRGYTIGKVGFCTGTGDFIVVAACYNQLKPGNVLQKYWGHRDAKGNAIDGLIYYNDQYIATGNNQADTSKIDSLGSFKTDVATAAADSVFRDCQDSLADADYLALAAQHVADRKMSGALTVGFLYDTELNFGDGDDPGNPDAGVPSTAGTLTVMARADKDYGASLPTDFTGKPWEESKWLGYVIMERTKVMAGNSTWKSNIDQNSTWEAARRLHTGMSASTETNTVLDMDFDLTSKYKSGATSAGTPCWPTGLTMPQDTMATIYTVSTDKTASATDATKWTGVGKTAGTTFAACPANPTP
jgi:hypothetical protein